MRELKIIQHDDCVEKKNSIKVSKTLLQHIECIIELVENSGLNEEFFKKAEKSITLVSKRMKITAHQVILLSVFIEKSDNNRISISELSSFIGCRNIKTISLMSDIDELEKRRLVRCRRKEGKCAYRVPTEVVNSIKQDIVYEPEKTEGLTTKELFKHIDRLFSERDNNEISYDALMGELQSLLTDNASLTFCRQIKAYEKICSDKNMISLLLFFCHLYVNSDDDCVGFHDIEELYEEKWMFREVRSDLQHGECELLEHHILEYSNSDGFGDREYFKISETAKDALFLDLDIKAQQADNKKGLTPYVDIVQKELFYNEREQQQVGQLASLLSQDKFSSVQKRLEECNMRKGFACLFYGAPGTGKTETVYQLARSTGRDIMMVDIAESKSAWFGESEKRIKKVFDTYRAYLKSCEVAPILLFNEADAIIGKRREIGNSSVDQTENAIQNILLQEMENLEGIMIATTNLTQNLDKAFERRFLYKIEFNKPSVQAKEKIWNTMLPSLSEEERLELANNYSFSGGQIENIVRKYRVDAILNDTEPSMESIRLYCQSEFLYKNEERRKIGYKQYGKEEK